MRWLLKVFGLGEDSRIEAFARRAMQGPATRVLPMRSLLRLWGGIGVYCGRSMATRLQQLRSRQLEGKADEEDCDVVYAEMLSIEHCVAIACCKCGWEVPKKIKGWLLTGSCLTMPVRGKDIVAQSAEERAVMDYRCAKCGAGSARVTIDLTRLTSLAEPDAPADGGGIPASPGS